MAIVDTGALKGAKGKGSKVGTPAAVKGKAATPPKAADAPKTVGRGMSKGTEGADKAPGIPRVSKLAGKKFKKGKANDAREGTFRHGLIAAVQASKTYEEAVGKSAMNKGESQSINAGHVNWVHSQGYVETV